MMEGNAMEEFISFFKKTFRTNEVKLNNALRYEVRFERDSKQITYFYEATKTERRSNVFDSYIFHIGGEECDDITYFYKVTEDGQPVRPYQYD
jgi:hypothetical protein